jgi:serine/threonine protein kinase
MSNLEPNRANSGDLFPISGAKMHHPGKIIDNRYQIVRQLGRGGFGRTYLANDLSQPDRPQCVIKQLQPQTNNPRVWENAKQRFVTEASILQRLGSHDQIPQLIAYFEEEQEFYLIQEYIEGQELQTEIEHQTLNETQVLTLLQDVLRILDFVHKTHVIHRDIKPANLIRRRQDGRFVLIDFGAVKEIGTIALSPQGQAIFTQMVGTQGFMPPEQIAGQPTFASDLYALGKTVIYALTGRSPLELEHLEESKQQSWQAYCQINSRLAAIINRMVSPKCVERYNSAIEVLYDLQPLLKVEQVVGGRYRITQYLGGKAGIYTYLAENLWRHYQSPCVIKEIKFLDRDPTLLQVAERQFSSELAVLERLSYHEQIPQVWDHFEDNGEFYLVEEYIAGENLQQKLQQNQRLTEEQVVELLGDALNILAFIHQHRVIHRDIKPSNLLIRNSDRRVMLIDFGMLQEIVNLPKQKNGLIQPVGTKAYMPPEQIGGRPTVSSDLYALGITAICALTGVKPELIPTDEKTGEIVWQEELQINRKLQKILAKMTSLDLGKRYQSAEKILSDLNKVSHLSGNFSLSETISSNSKSNNNFWSKNNLLNFVPQTPTRKINWIYVLVALAGIASLLGSIEFFSPTLRPIYYWSQGQRWLVKEPEEALAKFQQAIDLQPKNVQAWQGRGDALYYLERFPEALAAYDEALQLDPQDAATWKSRGDALYRLERFPAALVSYEKSLQLGANNTETWNRKGRALYKLEKYSEAITAQDKALEIDPNNAQALSDRGIALIGLGKNQEALSDFNRAQVLKPLDPRFWQNKALALQYLGQNKEANRVYQEAIVAYDRVLQQNSKNVIAWIDRGNVFSKLQQPQKALDSYEKALAIQPESHLAWLGKGNALFAMGKYPEALAAFDRALEIKPEDYLIWHNRGSLLRDGMGKLTEAIASFERAIAMNPSFVPAWRDRGLALSQTGEQNEAIKSFDKALKINPNDHKSWVGRGIALAFQNKTDEALAAFERAEEIDPNDPFVWMNKGSALEGWQRYNEACDAYRQARMLNSEFTPAIQALKRLGCRMF